MFTETSGLRYTVTAAWVRSVLASGPARWTGDDIPCPLSGADFESLLPLLHHGAMESTDAPSVGAALTPRLQEAFEGSTVKQFVADARVFSGLALSIRGGDVRLRTGHALSARFCPPAPKDVATSLGTALRYVETSLSRNRGNSAKIAICALLGAQVLLTIHPFADGNGRTARMYFAAKVLRHIGPAPTVLLGMMLMYRGGAHLYHLASWELRSGNVEPMVELFASSVVLARDHFLQCALTNQPSANFLAQCWQELQVFR